MKENNNIRYLNVGAIDEKWGIVVTTAGYQYVPPFSPYPLSEHPTAYSFNPEEGRIFSEYQLVYISKGSGYFESRSCKRKKVNAGSVIMLFPHEWHNYYPDQEEGWYEHWVGFRGEHIDRRIDNKFFSKERPVYEIGHSTTLIELYEDIVNYASEEKTGYQQLISSIVLFILGYVYYKDKNSLFNDSMAVEKINSARSLMKKNIDRPLSIREIAQEINVGYSWFRSMFKRYTGVSPAQYQLQLRHTRAKDLLNTTQMSISQIADMLGFENIGQFSSFFRKREGVAPSQFRRNIH